MTEQYILPGELAALLAFVFAPPLLVALGVQASFFTKRGMLRSRPWRALLAFVFTALPSVTLGTGVLIASPHLGGLSSILGLAEVRFSGGYWPVLPLAFVAVGVVAPFTAWWAARAA